MPSFGGEIAQSLRGRNQDKAKEVADFYKKVFSPEGQEAPSRRPASGPAGPAPASPSPSLGPKARLEGLPAPLANRLFIEITRHPEIDGHEQSMRALADFGRAQGIPLAAAHDVYYLHPEDRQARETLVRVNSHTDASDRVSDSDEDDFSFISGERAEELFRDMPEALENAARIADACALDLKLGTWFFPDFKVESGLSADDELHRLVFEGFARRGVEKTPEAVSRAEYELKVIRDKGYAPYFLVVADLLRYARECGILSNIRGSVSGSMVTYLSGITQIDPLAFEIPFERFLNPDRPSAPDIDMDYADDRRDEMIDYVRRKYGADRVAQIGTFGTMMARGSVRDVTRALGFPVETGDRIAKMIPMGSQGFPMTIDHALETVPELKTAYDAEPDVRRIMDMAKKIEGCARHIGVHAAGVVIAPTALTDYTPLQYDPKGEGKVITQYDMYSIDENGAGLLKFDFLGLKNLTIIADAVSRIKKIEGAEIDLDALPIDDAETFAMLARGDTADLFQLNGDGMTRFLKELKPSTIHDINAMVALYRPGPMQFIPDYIARKNDPSLITYLDPALEKILGKTYGILVYQDDLLMMAHELAGYSWLEVDKFRKAVGKKIPEEMAQQKEKFIKGCVSHSKWSEKKAKEIWKWIEPFAAYGFNKAHSVSYGRVAYITAYLKAHFPEIYLSAVLTSEQGDTEKVAETIAECKRLGIPVLPPDVNESFSQFTVVKREEEGEGRREQGERSKEKGGGAEVLRGKLSEAGEAEKQARAQQGATPVAEEELPRPLPSSASGSQEALPGSPPRYHTIRFGLVTIKNFGQGISTAIIEERKRGGRFSSLADFLGRIKDRNLNKKSLESLIMAGALDCFGEDRGVLLANIDLLLGYNKEQQSLHGDQDSLFGLMDDHTTVPTLRLNAAPVAELMEKLRWEKELLGLYLSGHPLDRYRDLIAKRDTDIKKALAMKEGASAIFAGIVNELRTVQTKNNETMAFLTVADFSGSADAVVFPRTYREYREQLVPDACFAFKATVNERNGEKGFVVERMKKL
ncbi:MAG: DNA polymerase III subunit alpha [Patescibacteria group bacterium]|nr:DNA polymerase III subunit alpha [Patescibacteria group bacterium]